MTERITLRGVDSIEFLGAWGLTFSLPYGRSKKAMPKGWNLPGAGVDAAVAVAHYGKGNNVDLFAEHATIIDIDFDFPQRVAALGDSAHTIKIWRDNAPGRGALIYTVIDGPVLSATWKPEGATEPHAELLAQTSTGNFKKKSLAGLHNGGEYCLVDAQYGIKAITRAELAHIWQIISGTELYAPKPTRPHKAAPVERKPIGGHDDLPAQVKAHWPPLAVFEYHGWAKNGTETERGGAVRVLGHGGLICAGDGVLWHSFADDKGGDAIDAWAHCTRRDRDQHFRDILEEMADVAGIVVQRPSTPLPEGAKVLDSGAIVLATTATPEPKPTRKIPVLTPSVVAKLAEALRGPLANTLIDRLGNVRDREKWRDFFIQLVTQIAPGQKSWVIDAGQDWLGERFGISGVAVRKKLHTMDSAGLIRYLHTGKVDSEKTGRSVMRVDLQPMIADLWESCAKLENKSNLDNEFSNFRNDPPVNVHAIYSGTGKYADASMRTLYKFAVARMGYPTVLARSVTKSALTFLDYLVRNGAATRAETCAGTGMTPGAAAGGSRVLEQIGLVSVEWEGPGTPKIYVLRSDWETHLQATIPHMASYGARVRLVIRNYDRWIGSLDRQLETTYSPQMRHQLNEYKERLEGARRKWCDYGSKIGAYGRYVEINPPW
jgi:hypothetical protein